MQKNPKVIRLIIILLFIFCARNAEGQKDSILSQKVGDDAIDVVQKLIAKGIINQSDKQLIGIYIVNANQNGVKINDLTYSQLLDSISGIKNKMVGKVAKENNFGSDSVFIRTPNGERHFIGLGKLSFEKLVERSSMQLPKEYKDDYNLYIDGSPKSSNAIAKLCGNSDIAWIIGNVIFIKKDKGELNGLKIGDLVEISQRIKASDEFAPFINGIK